MQALTLAQQQAAQAAAKALDASAKASQLQSQHDAENQTWQQEVDSLLRQKQDLSATLAAANDNAARCALLWLCVSPRLCRC